MDIEFGNLEEIDDTIFYLQDIPVVGCKEEARVFWDDGSNRVFIREDEFEEESSQVFPGDCWTRSRDQIWLCLFGGIN